MDPSYHLVIGGAILYVEIVIILSNRRYFLLDKSRISLYHTILVIAAAGAGIFEMTVSDDIKLWHIYFFTPLMFHILLHSANTWSHNRYGRDVIPAHRFNMKIAKEAGAKFSDYFLFIMINFLPLIIPMFIYYNILGKS